MTIQDPISDMLTRIRNGQMAKAKEVSMPASKQKEAIARVLKEEGYILDYQIEKKDNHNLLIVVLKYYRGTPVIRVIRRISKPGLRVYARSDQLPQVMGGLGVAIISTSKGVMTDHAARGVGLGGEVVCCVE